jgi:hypothetical protein
MLAALIVSLTCAGVDTDWAAADAAFRDGVSHQDDRDRARRSFADAADRFAELERQGVRTPELYRNLGNASYLAGRLPEALAAYRRGLRDIPGDRRLHALLERARADVHPPSGSSLRPAFKIPLPWSTPKLLGGFATVLFVVACLLLPRGIRSGRRGFIVGGGLAAIFVLAAIVLASQLDEMRQDAIVIVREDVALRTGNGDSYDAATEAPTMPRGQEVRVLRRRGSWLQVESPGGAIGWLPTQAVVDDSVPTGVR